MCYACSCCLLRSPATPTFRTCVFLISAHAPVYTSMRVVPHMAHLVAIYFYDSSVYLHHTLALCMCLAFAKTVVMKPDALYVMRSASFISTHLVISSRAHIFMLRCYPKESRWKKDGREGGRERSFDRLAIFSRLPIFQSISAHSVSWSMYS